LGDGATSKGDVWEAMNFAGVSKLPMRTGGFGAEIAALAVAGTSKNAPPWVAVVGIRGCDRETGSAFRSLFPQSAGSRGTPRDPTKVWTPEELLAIAFKRPPLFAPGKEYDYCNTNYALLGFIAEKLEGAPLAKVFQDRLFGPLGMKHTLLPANTSNTIPEPYSHGYLYGSSSYALVDAPYPADLQAAAKAGTLKPNDDTGQNPSYAFAAGGVISTADDLAIWMRALAGGKLFDANHQRQWLDSLEPQDPSKPLGQKYGYGISQISFGPNSVYFHGGEMPGYNSFMGYDPVNDVTLVIWTNLTLSLDGKPTANSIMLRMLDQIYSVSPLQ
jgi:D-alanyl-D-alanine carboxypeptidase